MNITITNSTIDKKPRKNADQSRFNKLWQEVKKKQKRNDKLKLEMEALLTTYTQKVMPVELGLEEPLILLAHRLVDFAGRKSLAQWQRAELQDWIAETLHEISQYNVGKAEEISVVYNQVLAEYYNISVEELTEPDQSIEDNIDSILNDVFESMTQESGQAKNTDQEDLFGFDDEDDDLFTSGNFSGDNAESTLAPERKEQPINEKWIRNLFRRTARVLHPDKEQDPEQRQQKQRLMTQLLDAREQQDVMTMMQLYSEHVDDGELSMEQAEINTLCRLLENQKTELDMTREALIDESPMHYAVHGKLYAATKKTRDKKLQTHLDGIQAGIKQKFKLVEFLRNLTNLKAVLEERYEDKRYMGW
jgi:hypothetical protein